MQERFLNVHIQIIGDDSPLEIPLEGCSGFLQSAHSLKLGSVIGNAEADFYSNSKQAELWADLKAKDGVYDFELATELPFYLPAMRGKQEYFLSVGGAELFVCLRMVRAFVGEGMPDDGLRYFLVHRLLLPSLCADGKHKGLHPIRFATLSLSSLLGSRGGSVQFAGLAR